MTDHSDPHDEGCAGCGIPTHETSSAEVIYAVETNCYSSAAAAVASWEAVKQPINGKRPNGEAVISIRGLARSYPMGESVIHALRGVDVHVGHGE